MSASKTLAFVLNTQDYRDTSLLGDLYTRDYGRIRGIVKGIRDTRARFGSTLEPFSLNEVLFYRRRKGGDLHLITQVDLVDLFQDVREDLERLAAASYCTELVRELVENEESSPEIFTLMLDTFKFLSSGASVKRVLRIFEVKLLDLLGLMPEVKACVFCRAVPQGAVYFDAGAGGIRCRDCGSAGMPVSLGTLNFMDHVKRVPVSGLMSVKVSQGVGQELERVLRRFTDFHLSHKLKTLTFMEKIGL